MTNALKPVVSMDSLKLANINDSFIAINAINAINEKSTTAIKEAGKKLWVRKITAADFRNYGENLGSGKEKCNGEDEIEVEEPKQKVRKVISYSEFEDCAVMVKHCSERKIDLESSHVGGVDDVTAVKFKEAVGFEPIVIDMGE
ncbi:hypothetical protein QYF36_004187 [Acer negundo]|nr:hypothetical protein QYF36_004187 [Acer negundo]